MGSNGKIEFREHEQGKTLEVKVYYTLGGINYFTGSTSRRGVYVSLTPVEYNGNVKSMILLGDENKSGLRLCLEELRRDNHNKVVAWAERIKPLLNEMYSLTHSQGVRSAMSMVKDRLGVI